MTHRLGRDGNRRKHADRSTTGNPSAHQASNPPASTRAYFRGRCLERWPYAVIAANWDSLILDVGADPLKRIPMMEPLRGTKAHVEALFEQARTPADLVAQLAS